MKTVILLLISLSLVRAQEFSPAIEDNSFFIEEAYNQEEHVVQHIFNGVSKNPFETSFTQEWPAFGQMHQLSFTLPYQFTLPKTTASQGIGDVLINYRYQLINENELAIAPRVSIILPTGDEAKGFGNGVVGAQFNLSVSRRFSNEIVTHYNAGFTVLPKVQFTTSKATITEYLVGVSGIYLANKHFNVMTEVLYTSSGSKFGRTNELIISPGVRWAIDIDELQIVPGLAFPFYFNSEGQENGFFLYLSFEHPY
jgi:hypothetical protein